MQTAGIGKSAGDLTALEAEWIRIHLLIARGYTYCRKCRRAVEPVRRSPHHLLDFGDNLRGYFHGAEKGLTAAHCPDCGGRLGEKRQPRPEEKQWCSKCRCGWPETHAFCSICGGDLHRDPAKMLAPLAQRAGHSDADWEEFKQMFNQYFRADRITPAHFERLEQLSEGPNKTTSKAWLQMAAADGGPA